MSPIGSVATEFPSSRVVPHALFFRYPTAVKHSIHAGGILFGNCHVVWIPDDSNRPGAPHEDMTTPSPKPRRVVVVVPNLFFAARILDTAKRLGIETLASSRATATTACRAAPTGLAIVDLESSDDPAGLIRELKADPATASIQVIGFYPHVRGALRAAALEAGADLVLPRSAFTARLPRLLAGDAGTVD